VKTVLSDRSIWYDGVVEVGPEKVQDLLLSGVPQNQIAVTELNDEIKKFNRFTNNKIGIKEKSEPLTFDWLIPEKYQTLDINKYVVEILSEKIQKDDLFEKRLIRLADELELFIKYGLENVFRTLIYVVDELRRTKSVWGVGRGSSCSSYLLYLLGLHSVDAVKYDIPITDFLK